MLKMAGSTNPIELLRYVGQLLLDAREPAVRVRDYYYPRGARVR